MTTQEKARDFEKTLEKSRNLTKDLSLLQKSHKTLLDGHGHQTLQLIELETQLASSRQDLEKERESNSTLRGLESFENELENWKGVVKVKEKMLEDQNETIKNLKRHLEAKVG